MGLQNPGVCKSRPREWKVEPVEGEVSFKVKVGRDEVMARPGLDWFAENENGLRLVVPKEFVGYLFRPYDDRARALYDNHLVDYPKEGERKTARTEEMDRRAYQWYSTTATNYIINMSSSMTTSTIIW